MLNDCVSDTVLFDTLAFAIPHEKRRDTKRMLFSDIFESDVTLPAKVCIVAPGFMGRDFHDRIPEDYCQIAVSKAILSPNVNSNIWVMNTTNHDWYDEANARFTGIRIYRDTMLAELASARAMGPRSSAALDRDVYQKDCYYFAPLVSEEGKLSHLESRPIEKEVRGGGSLAGCAIQIAYILGARSIVLCGVDMSGDQYWDGKFNVHLNHGDEWQFLPRLQSLIGTLTCAGVSFSTLSPTKLNVPTFTLQPNTGAID